MNLIKYLVCTLSILISVVSCDLIDKTKDENTDSNAVKLVSNIPDSNWESIIVMSSKDALCLNYSTQDNSELMAVIDNNSEISMTFDENRRPTSLIFEEAEFYAEYLDDHCNLIYNIDDISGLEIIPTKTTTKASGEEAFDFALEVTKSKTLDKVIDKADEIIEKKFDKPDVLGTIDKFINMVNTLRELDDIDNALELVDYLESSNDIVKFINLIKTKPNHKQDNSTTYIVGITAGDSEVDGNVASLELRGTIKGISKGEEFNFEYGLCYSASNNMPIYSDGNTGTKYSGLMVNPMNITLPRRFDTPELDKGTYHYRGFFRDLQTDHIIYSENVGEFVIEEENKWVDLGLPSGILWAKYNVGASSPEEYGGYYAWGETEEKSSYSWENYKYTEIYYDEDGMHYRFQNIGTSISNSSVDVARLKWSDGARIPTSIECTELLSNCKIEHFSDYSIFTGPNGNSILLPFSGAKYETFVPSLSIIWTSTHYSQVGLDGLGAYAFCWKVLSEEANPGVSGLNRSTGLNIRPVKDKEIKN